MEDDNYYGVDTHLEEKQANSLYNHDYSVILQCT